MSTVDAAVLARGLLCAAILSIEKSQKIGAIVADAHFPILKWTITAQTETKKPLVIFSIPPGIDLTFQMTPQLENDLGATLVAHANGFPPPERPPEVVH